MPTSNGCGESKKSSNSKKKFSNQKRHSSSNGKELSQPSNKPHKIKQKAEN